MIAQSFQSNKFYGHWTRSVYFRLFRNSFSTLSTIEFKSKNIYKMFSFTKCIRFQVFICFGNADLCCFSSQHFRIYRFKPLKKKRAESNKSECQLCLGNNADGFSVQHGINRIFQKTKRKRKKENTLIASTDHNILVCDFASVEFLCWILALISCARSI